MGELFYYLILLFVFVHTADLKRWGLPVQKLWVMAAIAVIFTFLKNNRQFKITLKKFHRRNKNEQ